MSLSIVLILFVIVAVNLTIALGVTTLRRKLGLWLRHHILGVPQQPTDDVAPTRLARLGAGALPMDLGLVASFGKAGEAPLTIADRFLRPTIGLRLISFGISAAVLYVLWFGPEEMRLQSPLLNWALTAVVVYGVITIQTYEARYDDYRIVAPGRLMQRKEVLWKDVLMLRDDGHYLYVLHTEDGRRLEIQKYLVGIVDFVAYAQSRIAENQRT